MSPDRLVLYDDEDVLRNWHSRDEKIVKNMQDLVDTAKKAATCLEEGK